MRCWRLVVVVVAALHQSQQRIHSEYVAARMLVAQRRPRGASPGDWARAAEGEGERVLQPKLLLRL